MNRVTLVRPARSLSSWAVYAEGSRPRSWRSACEAYSKELRDPEVSVIVRTMAARVYVDGQIQRPGGYPEPPDHGDAGGGACRGLREAAEDEYLLVLRRRDDGAQEV
jgi:hypothetical protein